MSGQESPAAATNRERLAELLRRKEQAAPRSWPVSFSQQRLWFLHQLSPGSASYNVEAALPWRGLLDAGALARALEEVVRRHEVLRTTFVEQDGEPRQVVAPEAQVEVPLVDLSGLPEEERRAELDRLVHENANHVYDLGRGPLLRASLARLGPGDHVFLLGMHHIVADAWSMGVLTRELGQAYSAFASGRPVGLPPLPIQYKDFAVWQRRHLSGERLADLVAWWRSRLEGSEPLELPTDRPRPAVQTFRGAHRDFSIPNRLRQEVVELSHREGVTLFMTLLAAFQTLLHRYTGQDDVVVGTYVANRNRAEVEGLIGFFLNTLALRTSLGGDPTFRELLGRAKETALGAYAHQDLPFEKLVEELQPERDLSRNPIFQVTFQVPNAPGNAVADGPAGLDARRAGSAFDLAVMVWETPRGLSGQVEYATDLFDDSTIAALVDHYVVLIEGAVRRPDARVSELPLLRPSQVEATLARGRGPRKERPWEVGIPAILARRAAEVPDAVVLVEGDRRVTLAEVDRESGRLAHHLRERGLAPGQVAGVCLERSADLVVAALAVWKAGGVYLPLDPAWPGRRLRTMAETAGAVLVVAKGGDGFAPLPAVDVRQSALASEEAPILPFDPDRDAYVVFTSGSTGAPKGIAATHRQVLNRLHWMWESWPFAEGEVGCVKTAVSFVDSLWEILGPVLAGVPSVVAPEAVVRDPERMVDLLARHGVSRLWFVPSYLRMLLDHVPDLGRRLPRLLGWVSSGEPLPVDLFHRFREAFPAASLFNLYGTSEVWDATWWAPDPAVPPDWRVPVGLPIDNVDVYVLDRHRRPVPAGVVGELYVAGLGLARGYLGPNGGTADRFVLLDDPPARAYRTGDAARWGAHGQLELVGRMDGQLKIRGVRVEPDEVALALRAAAGVHDAVVLSVGEGAGAQLVAWFVPEAGADPSVEDLRRALAATLPSQMLPARFVRLDALPTNPNGKVDRAALRAAGGRGARHERPFEPPAGAVEEGVAAIWRELLGRSRVGRHDDFFDLGGHSLLAAQVASRIRGALGAELPLRAIFEAPTVAGLAAAVARASPGSEPIRRAARERYRVPAGGGT